MTNWGRAATVVVSLMAVLAMPAAGQSSSANAGGGIRVPRSREVSASLREHAERQYGLLSLAFEPNRGQVSRQVRYLARGANDALGLTESGPVLELDRRSRPVELASTFIGERRGVRLVDSGKTAARVNDLIGRNARHWRTNIPTFSRVSYQHVWPGINVAFHGNQRALEYDYRLAPGADPARIGVRFRGARSVRIGRHGDLVLTVAGGRVRELAPRAYQELDGVRRTVTSRFVLGRDGRVGVRVGAYDRRRELVIDPSLVYSTYLGRQTDDVAVTADAAGHAYVTGETFDTSFPTTTGAYRTTAPFTSGHTSAFVTKFSADGTGLVYSTYLGGSGGADEGRAIALDTSGDAFVTGTTNSDDFPTTSGAYRTVGIEGAGDAFVTKLSPDGSKLLYSTYLGGTTGGSSDDSGDDDGLGIAVDAFGQAYVAGSTDSTDFPTTPGAFESTDPGERYEAYEAFVTKLNTAGSGLLYSTYLGGTDGGAATPTGIALDSSGAAYLTGTSYEGYEGGDFPTTSGAFQPTRPDNPTVFVTKVDPGGDALLYSTFLGGGYTEFGGGIAVNASGGAYVTGTTESNNFPTTSESYEPTNPVDPTAADNAGNDIGEAPFVTELNGTGSAPVYSTYLSGTAGGDAKAIALDGANDAYITGYAFPGHPTTSDAYQTTASTGGAFMTELGSDGTSLAYSTYLANQNGSDHGYSIATDSAGNVYLAGTTTGGGPTTPGAFDTTFPGGNYSLFVAKSGGFGGGTGSTSTSTGLTCAPSSVTVGSGTICTVTVTDTGAGASATPSGSVSFASDSGGSFSSAAGSTFTSPASCTLAGSGTTASCAVTFTPSSVGSGSQTITASYGGDTIDAGSNGPFNLTVTVPHGTHTLSVSKAGSGSGAVTSGDGDITCGSICSHSYTTGSTVTLSASADAGSTFVGWSGGGCSGTGTCAVTVNANKTVTARFRAVPVTRPPSWTGKWITSSTGETISMTLVQLGDVVTGHYSLCQGTITGTVSGDTLTGSWSQAVPRPCGGTGEPTNGHITFTMSADGSSFDGSFTWTGSAIENDWSGARVYPASTKVACAPASVTAGTSTTCTATVKSRAQGGSSAFQTPTGAVAFTSSPTTATFGDSATCTLAPTATAGAVACSVTFTPAAAGRYVLRASYGGDTTHRASRWWSVVNATP